MYKLFLTFRYLTRKKIVLFPILVVGLCVMMLIIVTSIMQGFVDRVRDANRALYGDIIISCPTSSYGFEGYEELSRELKASIPEIQITTPTVEIFALLYAPFSERSIPSLLVGVKPEERSAVAQFRETLYQQYLAPNQVLDILTRKLPATSADIFQYALRHQTAAEAAYQRAVKDLDALRDPKQPSGLAYRLAFDRLWTLAVAAVVTGLLLYRARKMRSGGAYITAAIVGMAGLAIVVLLVCWPVLFPRQRDVASDRVNLTLMDLRLAQRTCDLAATLPQGTYRTRDDLARLLLPAKATFALPPQAKVSAGTQPGNIEGCIVGSQMAYRRDIRGNFVREYPDRYNKVSITVFPPSKGGNVNVQASNAVSQNFIIVDDAHTGVYDVDSLDVYANFDTVQFMAGMRPDPRLGPEGDFAPRAHQILIRLTPDGQAHMKDIRARIEDHIAAKMNASFEYTMKYHLLDVQTWDEKQARYIGAVQNEKTMMTFILLLMSGVVLVVIFLIFYQIVRDKTRDIGIIKAVGGSEIGVASIFLSYGLLIGIVGGGLGAISGWLFVTHTNEIHDLIFQTTGLIIWDRSVYLFDRIPDVVRLGDVLLYYGVALVAGVAGAIIPAILAALEDPVQAVRYE